MTVIAIVQARTSSSRLPGKVMMPIGTKPMVLYQLDRLQRCTQIDRVVLATSVQLRRHSRRFAEQGRLPCVSW